MNHLELKGQHVSLIPLHEDHMKAIYKAAKPQEIWEWNATKIGNWEDVKTYVKTALHARDIGQHYAFVVVSLDSQEVIGSTSFRFIDFSNRTVEIGSTWYHPSYWRTSVNTECKALLLNHAFENWKMQRVEFRTDERNIRSQTAIARLGASKEGILRKERIIVSGFTRNTVVFSIIDEEWPEVQKHLSTLMNR